MSVFRSFLLVVASLALPHGPLVSQPAAARTFPCATWTNPSPSPFDPDAENEDAHPDLSRVPEGLTLVGPQVDAPGETLPLDCGKPTVVFIHGWSPYGEATYFTEAPAWRARFNVFVFRWHKLAYSPRTVFPAENRVPLALERLEREVDTLYRRLGGAGYRHEFRIVGHSLGAQLALPLARGVLAQGLTHPRRLELIDPFLWTDLRRLDSGAGSASGQPRWDLVPSQHYEDLRMVRAMGVKTVVYATSVQRNVGKRMPEVANVQAMHDDWLGGHGPTSHIEMATWYFQSFQEAPPALVDANGVRTGEAFSASLPTENFPAGRVKYLQIPQGLDTTQSSSHVFSRAR